MSGNGKVFISHAHDDNPRCQPLLDALAAWGVDYWFDKERMDAGQAISRRIEDAIVARDVFIRIGSGNVQQRPYWIDLETDTFRSLMADDENKGLQGKRRLITLVLDSGYIPRPFERAALVLDTTRMTQEQWLAELRRALGLGLGSQHSAPLYSATNEPPTRIVDALHRGDHATIAEAIKAAKPGDRILIRPGLYREALVIDKPLEIVGAGELGDVVIEASGTHTIRFATTYGRVAKLTIRQKGDGLWDAVDISQGRLDLEDCEISSQGRVGVAIRSGADPRVRRNRIHTAKYSGINVYDNGAGTIEDNDISGNGSSGIQLKESATPTVRHNRIHDNKSGGVYIYDNGAGTIEDNDIFGNGLSCIEMKDAANPLVRHNKLHNSTGTGVLVHGSGACTVEDNDIFSNAYSGVEVREGGTPTLRRNTITKNAYQAIYIHDNGGGTFEDNDLRGNTHGAWSIEAGSQGNVKRARNQE